MAPSEGREVSRSPFPDGAICWLSSPISINDLERKRERERENI
ncbi:MAG: hypothetical protein ACTS4W_01490 [Candidatus Hodgkinia cicadicola]